MRVARHSAHVLLAAAALLVGIFVAPSSARAEADTFGLGSGRSGTQTVSGIINSYAAIIAASGVGATSVTVDSNTGFSAGDLVLVWRTAGYSGATAGAQTAIDLSSAPVGSFEFARIASFSSAIDITFTNPLVNAYPASGAQVVRVPEYVNVTINGAVTPLPWDGTKGGIVVFFATGSVTISGGGSISANGTGFRGGVAYNNSGGSAGGSANDLAPSGNPPGGSKGEGIQSANYSSTPASAPASAGGHGNYANGPGGGNGQQGGGGGGGSAGQGGDGGNGATNTDLGGLGGAALSLDNAGLLTHLLMGGGGGAGQQQTASSSGGNGGGVIFVRAGSLASSGSITAQGASAGNVTNTNGASGGGAGGMVVLRLSGAASCSAAINVSGGNGGNVNTNGRGRGGGGGGGRVLVQRASGTSCDTPTVAGGAAGTGGNRAATAGAGGTTQVITSAFSPTACNLQDNQCGGCTASTPDCVGSPRGSLCDTSKHSCGNCLTSANCSGTTPACNTAPANDTCAACQSDTGAGPLACPDPLFPRCLASGACGECRDYTHCGGAKPVCNVNATCVACNGDNGSNATAPCPTTQNPFCAGGACTRCVGNADCVARPGTPICNVGTGLCGTACFGDLDCSSTQYCDRAVGPDGGLMDGVCTNKVPNGQPLPQNVGSCTGAVGTRVCLSGVCDPADNACGYSKGFACGNDAQCRGFICSPIDGRCGRANGEPCQEPSVCRSGFCVGGQCVACKDDRQCGALDSARVCSDSTHTCTDGCRGNGNHCPEGLTCTSNDSTIGVCVKAVDAGAEAAAPVDAGTFDATLPQQEGGAEAGPPAGLDSGYMAGNGVSCAAGPVSSTTGAFAGSTSLALALVALARRRKR
jgi:hypothetical protein